MNIFMRQINNDEARNLNQPSISQTAGQKDIENLGNQMDSPTSHGGFMDFMPSQNNRRNTNTPQARENTSANDGQNWNVTPSAPDNNQPATSGGDWNVTPSVPNNNQPATPGGDWNVTPSVPNNNQPATPGGDWNVTPSVPNNNQPATPGRNVDVMPTLPGLPPIGGTVNVIPILPSYPNSNVTIIPIVPGVRRAYIRIFNAMPSAGPVDVYISGVLVARGLAYKSYTDYSRISSGSYRIRIFKTGTTTIPIIDTVITIAANTIYTAALIGQTGYYGIRLFSDRPRSTSVNVAFMRFANVALNAPSFDIYVDNIKVVSNIMYEELSSYMAIRPGRHNIKITAHNTENVLVEEPDINVSGNMYYTTYIVGDMNTRPGLQVLPINEGAGSLRF